MYNVPVGQVDAATAYVTRSALCVVLKEGDRFSKKDGGGDERKSRAMSVHTNEQLKAVRCVVQMINKLPDARPDEVRVEAIDDAGAAAADAAGAAAGDAAFDDDDVAMVREEGGAIVLMCRGLSLHQLLKHSMQA
jgi:hypothetical protein